MQSGDLSVAARTAASAKGIIPRGCSNEVRY